MPQALDQRTRTRDAAAPGTAGAAVRWEAGGGGAGTLVVSGNWTLHSATPGVMALAEAAKGAAGPGTLRFESATLSDWDSTFVAAVLELLAAAETRSLAIDRAGLPDGVQRLVALATSVPERQGARRSGTPEGFLARVGTSTLASWNGTLGFVSFLGEATIALGRFTIGRAKFRRVDLLLALDACGPKALPIISLISILIGMILAFVGAVQLSSFGADIFVADMVAIAMAREMAAIMTGIIMAGRTGAAFAAQLGTMQVNEEIDAFRTLGFQPVEFLVLPRMLALIAMMPLLCIYSATLGILGGGLVGVLMLGLTPTAYYTETIASVGLTDFAIGVGKSVIFGIIVAVTGCLKGIQSGRSASAVGDAATSAVVQAIVLIIVFDGMFAVVTTILGI